MAAGKPVVATDVSGMPLAVAPGETGLLVPERQPAALAAAVLDLLDDPARGRRLGEAGRARVERELNWGAIAGIHDGLARAAVAAAARPAGEG
jgi:phosphatidyl-myo-inositol dimannoside synthase